MKILFFHFSKMLISVDKLIKFGHQLLIIIHNLYTQYLSQIDQINLGNLLRSGNFLPQRSYIYRVLNEGFFLELFNLAQIGKINALLTAK